MQEDVDLVVMPSICRIVNFYEIESARCAQTNINIDPVQIAEQTSSGM
ncbi:hypothetical protein GW750_06605 [bacterium]|nr:hypothetical protein [bacterium]